MFQPTPPPSRWRADWLAIAREQLAAASAEAPADGTPSRAPDVTTETAAGLAWQEFERVLIAKRRREAWMCAALLEAKRLDEREQAAAEGPFARRSPFFGRAFLVEAALALDLSETTAVTLLHHLELVERSFPCTWDAFMAGCCDLRAVQVIARESEGLDLASFADEYDAGAVGALESVPGSRLKQHLHRLRERLQAATAKERRARAMTRCRVDVDVAADGMATLVVVGPAEDLLAVDDALQRAAVIVHGRPGEDRSITNLRYFLTRDLLLGGIAAKPEPDGSTTFTLSVPSRPVVVPTVNVTVPAFTLMGKDAGPADLDGYGPIDLDTARRLAGAATCWTRVLTDPITGFRLTLDREQYRPSAALRRWLQLRDGTCRWPGCTRPATRSDIDHQDEWQDGGDSDPGNLAHLCRRHHLMKSAKVMTPSHDPATDRIAWTSPAKRVWVSDPAPPSEPVPVSLLDEPCPF